MLKRLLSKCLLINAEVVWSTVQAVSLFNPQLDFVNVQGGSHSQRNSSLERLQYIIVDLSIVKSCGAYVHFEMKILWSEVRICAGSKALLQRICSCIKQSNRLQIQVSYQEILEKALLIHKRQGTQSMDKGHSMLYFVLISPGFVPKSVCEFVVE